MKNVTLSGDMPRRNVIGRFVENNSKMIVEVISALFILLFLYTAITKSFQIESTVNVIKKTPLISSNSEIVAWAVVIAEYIASILLFVPLTRRAGLYFSLGLMTIFTAYIGYMKLFIPKLPCSCGGVISKMTWSQHLIFNMIFMLFALIGILLSRKQNKIELETKLPNIVFT